MNDADINVGNGDADRGLRAAGRRARQEGRAHRKGQGRRHVPAPGLHPH